MPTLAPYLKPGYPKAKQNPNRAHLVNTDPVGLISSILGPYHGHRYGLFSLGQQYAPSIFASSLVDEKTLGKALDEEAKRILTFLPYR